MLSMSSKGLTSNLEEGAVAPDFELSVINIDGTQTESFKLSDFRGKQPVYLVFWNTWCGYCIKKTPKLRAMQEKFGDKIKIIGINTSKSDSVSESLVFQKKYAINYDLAFDYGETVTDLYDVWGTPTEFIVDINGVIQFRDGVPDDIGNYLSEWSSLSLNETAALSKQGKNKLSETVTGE